MDGWILDETSLGKWQYLQHRKSTIPQKLQRMTNNVGLTFNVGDNVSRVTIVIEQDNQNWLH